MMQEWWFWRIVIDTKKSPQEVDEQFTFEECLKYNAVLDMQEDMKVFDMGVNSRKTKG